VWADTTAAFWYRTFPSLTRHFGHFSSDCTNRVFRLLCSRLETSRAIVIGSSRIHRESFQCPTMRHQKRSICSLQPETMTIDDFGNRFSSESVWAAFSRTCLEPQSLSPPRYYMPSGFRHCRCSPALGSRSLSSRSDPFGSPIRSKAFDS
jgi:hypothetical protein